MFTISSSLQRFGLGMILSLGVLSGCGPVPSPNDAMGENEGGATGDAGHFAVPYVAGEFRRVFTPPGTNYLNDHTLIQDPVQGTWHLYGITHSSPGQPQNERELLHATAPALLGPWTAHAPILSAVDALGEQVLWAPYAFVSRESPLRYSMLYWAGDPTPGEPGVRRADSTDLNNWIRYEGSTPNRSRRYPGGRDQFAININGIWHLYSVGVDTLSRGTIVLTRTMDLDNPNMFSTEETVLTDPIPNFPWGNIESPFVVYYQNAYYLFVTRTSMAPADYVRTVVFRSTNPAHWDWAPITTIWSHAAEIVHYQQAWYITSGGWTASVGENNRGLLIAPLAWSE